MTDGLLEDDYKNPQATLKSIEQMHRSCNALTTDAIIPFLLQLPHHSDDVTLITLEIKPHNFPNDIG